MAMALEGHPCRTRGITVEGKLHGEDYSLIPKFEGPCFLKQPKSLEFVSQKPVEQYASSNPSERR